MFLALCFTANTFAITQAQIDQFKNLPEAQQKALAAQMGINLDQLKAAQQATSSPAVTDVPVVTPRNPDGTSTVTQDATNTNQTQNSNFQTSSNGQKNNTTQNKYDAADQQKPQKKIIRTPIKPFGYDLFAGNPSTFAPVTDVPIPSDYVMGPGDTVVVQLYGKENNSYSLQVNRDGSISFPNVGPVSVAGLSFTELQRYIKQLVNKKMLGVQASVTLGSLRSIRIFVLGEAYRPGSYTVSSLSTLTNALFVSGGVKKIGSLRDIQLKRAGKVISHFDLYDLLLKGDSSKDKRLQPGDVIFIPPIGKTVGINGEVRRPAIYELKNEKTAGDLIKLAGGFLPTAYPSISRLERIGQRGNRTLLDLNLSKSKGLKEKINDGDTLQVFSVLDKVNNLVTLSGHVQRPGKFSWFKGMKLSDVIQSPQDLLPGADLHYGIIERLQKESGSLTIKYVDLAKLFANPSGSANIALRPKDKIDIFSVDEDRSKILKPVIDSLKQQASYQDYAKIVSIKGAVRYPGQYPYLPGMTVKEALLSAFTLQPDADLNYVLVKRLTDHRQQVKVYNLNLTQPAGEQFTLQPEDQLLIFSRDRSRGKLLAKLIQDLKQQATKQIEPDVVSVNGQVKFPGEYPLTQGMKVSNLLLAAGGLKESAYLVTADLSRFQTDLTQNADFKDISVNLQNALRNGNSDILLKSRDKLFIKKIPKWQEQESITLSGEFKFPGVYTFNKGQTLSSVIKRAGGLTHFAYPQGAVFSRLQLKKDEAKNLETMRKRLSGNIAKAELTQTNSITQKKTNTNKIDEITKAQKLLAELDKTKAVGRLVIDLNAIMANKKGKDIELRDGDTLYVPTIRNSVTTIGEIQFPNSQVFNNNSTLQDYINQSGGYTPAADADRVYVVKANGAVSLPNQSHWFSGDSLKIEPGDTIVVPLDTRKLDQLQLWTNVSQIFYQIALGASAVRHF
jgi:polysaccharide export outer membrane protein